MDKRCRSRNAAKISSYCSETEELSRIEWDLVNMSAQEEDLIYRMYKLVGDRWALIAGRIPGRKAEEIERFWIMKHAGTSVCKQKERAQEKKHKS